MGKRIVVCTDGTWDGSGNNTNVYKLYKAVSVNSDQIAFYDDGVGEDGLPIERLLGGAFGIGLFQKIKQAYTQIAHVFEAGDELFLFGFSRGAYTARSLAGMIAICGIPTKNFTNDVVETAFNAYRNKDQRAPLLTSLKDCEMYDAKITMLGVWDTVGALGIPAIFGAVSPLVYGFLDTSLHPDVLNAYQALAIDERRAEFPPTLWTSAPAQGRVLEQVWFCGVHCDVGGGYADDAATGSALSDITLSWILAKACILGLAISALAQTQYAAPVDPKYALDQVHDSWSPLWGFPRARNVSNTASLSNSAAIRCMHVGSYRPSNLDLVNGAPADTYQIVPAVAQPLQFVAAAGA